MKWLLIPTAHSTLLSPPCCLKEAAQKHIISVLHYINLFTKKKKKKEIWSSEIIYSNAEKQWKLLSFRKRRNMLQHKFKYRHSLDKYCRKKVLLSSQATFPFSLILQTSFNCKDGIWVMSLTVIYFYFLL